jgi:LuxR family glucitol operon transcriptional activator
MLILFLRFRAYSLKSCNFLSNGSVTNPLLIKWFALGVLSGLSPNAIIRSPDLALKFCLENVIDKLDDNAKLVALVFAHVSGSHSSLVVEHLSGLSAKAVEQSITTLLQFLLIEDNSKETFERTYGMGTFARSYLTRIEKSKPTEVQKILDRAKRMTITYQVELATSSINRYSFEHYTVRSRSETIAASHLRHASREASRGNFDLAMRIIDGLKISSPEYLQVYRVSAAVHVKQRDLQTPISDYETAIDVDPQQPQLYYWYAGFLMRWLDDFDGATRMFNKALELDPNSEAVLREAARNEFFASRFTRAQELVDRANNLKHKSLKDAIIFGDLQAQIYIRTADALAQAGDFVGAMEILDTLKTFVGKLDDSHIDSTFCDHLVKVRRYSAAILLQRGPNNVVERVQAFLAWLDSFLSAHGYTSLKRQEPREEKQPAGRWQARPKRSSYWLSLLSG